MVKAWYMDDKEGDLSHPHMKDPPEYVELDIVKKSTGVEYFHVDVEKYVKDGHEDVVNEIKEKRGYKFEEESHLAGHMENYHEMMSKHYDEHIHTDEEVHLTMDGTSYFDARDTQDRWIRVELTKGDLIIVPAGTYHRFSLTEKHFVVDRQFFVDDPGLVEIHRPCDDHPVRQEYVQKMTSE